MGTIGLIDLLYRELLPRHLPDGSAQRTRLQLIYEKDIGKIGMSTGARMRLLQLMRMSHATN